MSLPKKLDIEMMQTQWASKLDPVIANVLMHGVLLKNVHLVSGANVVNHRLQRTLQGWFITRLRAQALVSDTQDSNQMPQLTLNLQSSAAVVVDIYLF